MTGIVSGTWSTCSELAARTAARATARCRTVTTLACTSGRPVACDSGPMPSSLAIVGPTSRPRPARVPRVTPAPQTTIGILTTSRSVPPCPPSSTCPWSDVTTSASRVGSSVRAIRPIASSARATAARYSGDTDPNACPVASTYPMCTKTSSAGGTGRSGS